LEERADLGVLLSLGVCTRGEEDVTRELGVRFPVVLAFSARRGGSLLLRCVGEGFEGMLPVLILGLPATVLLRALLFSDASHVNTERTPVRLALPVFGVGGLPLMDAELGVDDLPLKLTRFLGVDDLPIDLCEVVRSIGVDAFSFLGVVRPPVDEAEPLGVKLLRGEDPETALGLTEALCTALPLGVPAVLLRGRTSAVIAAELLGLDGI